MLQYTYQLPGNRLYDQWLMELTAVWAEDYVYREANTEQAYLSTFFDNPGLSLNDTAGAHDHGAYLFPFYLARRYSPDLIRRMWVATETTVTPPAAVNSVIEGGFEKQWPEFRAVQLGIARPKTTTSVWDMIPGDVNAPDIPVPGSLDGFPANDFDMSVPTDVRPLAAYYHRFVFRSDEARSGRVPQPLLDELRPRRESAGAGQDRRRVAGGGRLDHRYGDRLWSRRLAQDGWRSWSSSSPTATGRTRTTCSRPSADVAGGD